MGLERWNSGHAYKASTFTRGFIPHPNPLDTHWFSQVSQQTASESLSGHWKLSDVKEVLRLNRNNQSLPCSIYLQNIQTFTPAKNQISSV